MSTLACAFRAITTAMQESAALHSYVARTSFELPDMVYNVTGDRA